MQPTDTPSLQAANSHTVYADGQEVASLDEAGKIDALSHVTAFASSVPGTTQLVGDVHDPVATRIVPSKNRKSV